MDETSKHNALSEVYSLSLKETFYKRAHLHSKSAAYDMVIIVVILFSCISIFVGADRLSDFIFKSSIERRADAALSEAKSKLYLALAKLADPVEEAIRNLPPTLRPVLDKLISTILQTYGLEESGNKVQTRIQPVLPLPPLKSEAEKLPSQESSKQSSEFDIANRKPLSLYVEHGKSLESPVNTVQQAVQTGKLESDTHYNQIVELRESILKLYEKNTIIYKELLEMKSLENRIDADVEIARINAENNRDIAEYKADVERNIAEYKADAEKDIAEYKADAERDIAQEATYLAQEWNSLSSRAVTRIGAVVLVLFLVRIFVKKRERSVRLAAFYLAIGDAITICGDNQPDKLPHVLPLLLPPETLDSQDNEASTSDIMGIAKAVIQRRPDVV